MAVQFASEESVVDVEKAGKMMLQDIYYGMSEPERTHYIHAWVAASEFADDGGLVVLATPDRKPMRLKFEGQEHYISARGKLFDRRQALRLFGQYGERGLYRGRDHDTGMTRYDWEALQTSSPEYATRFQKHTFDFMENYLIQVPRGSDADESEEPKEGKK